MALTRLGTSAYTTLDATKLTGNLVQEGSSTDNLLQFTMNIGGTDVMQIYQETAMTSGFTTGYNSTLLDITDTSTAIQFRFVNVTAGAALRGNSTNNETNATFIRLGDT